MPHGTGVVMWTVLAAMLLLSCSSDADERAHNVISLWPIPAVGAFRDRPPAGVELADAGPPPEPPPALYLDDDGGILPTAVDPGLSLLDPNEVYLFGTVIDVLGFPRKAIALATRPARAVVAFADGADASSAIIRPGDGRMLYRGSDYPLLAFNCDRCMYYTPDNPYPGGNPEANDEQIPVTPCAGSSLSFAVAPDGLVYHACNQVWYDGSGTELAVTGVRSFGHGGTALTATGVFDFATQLTASYVDLPPRTIFAIRAREDGYWIVTSASDHERLERWHVGFDGVATLDGTYSALSRDLVANGATRIDGRGRVVQFADQITNRGSSVIVRSSLEGDNEVIYDERSEPLVEASSTRDLFTGP